MAGAETVTDGRGGAVPGHGRRLAGHKTGGGRVGRGWPGGFFRPVHDARSRDSYRPPPELYRRLSGLLGPAAASLGLVPKEAAPCPEEIAPGVYRVATGRGLTGANVYLVRSGPGWVLIDAAWPRRGQLIRAAAESLFGAGTRPAAILLTHIHPDHSGSALELARLWDLPVYVHPDELVLAPGGYLPEYGNPLDRRLIVPLLRLIPRRTLEASRVRTSLEGTARAFDPAAGVPGLPDWQAVPTPGHTPGHVAFFRERDRVLITGDAVLTVNVNSVPGLLAGKHQVAGPPWISTWNWPAAEESVAVLAGLDPDVLACGHGRPMTGPGTAASLASFSGSLSQQRSPRRSRQGKAAERAGTRRAPAPGDPVPVVLVWGEAITARNLLRGIKRRAETTGRQA